jgi:hypothetical protein
VLWVLYELMEDAYILTFSRHMSPFLNVMCGSESDICFDSKVQVPAGRTGSRADDNCHSTGSSPSFTCIGILRMHR